MADVQGRLSGRASVCLSTLGPGATNLATGVADANMDRAPLVAVTGQTSTDRLHKESHQTMDLVSLFRPMVKYNAQVVMPEVVPEVVRKAFKVAQTEKYGATHIDLPEDVARKAVDERPLLPQQPKDPEPLMTQIKRAAYLVNSANTPIVLAGNGVVRGKAAPALRGFVSKAAIPCANTFMAKGVLAYQDCHSLLAVGLQAHDAVNCGIDRADVIIAVGYDLAEYPPASWNPNGDKGIIHIDRRPAEVDSQYQLACGVEADIGLALTELADHVTPRDEQPFVTSVRETIFGELSSLSSDDGFPLKPQRILHEVRQVMGDQDILISDVGAHKLWVARMYLCQEPNTCIISNCFAAMGIGLPGAVGAKLLHPERKILTICGDGGFLMNVQELETAVRCNTPIVVLIWRDDSYGVIKWNQLNRFGRASHVDFGNPDFVALAKSFGCEGIRIEAATELQPALEHAFRADRPVVIDCPVDYHENCKLTERMGKPVCPS
jgi:acetolactate synthase-1/2/3 large subunit